MTAAMLDFPDRGGPFSTTIHPGEPACVTPPFNRGNAERAAGGPGDPLTRAARPPGRDVCPYAVSAWRTSATGRRMPIHAGMTVSAAITASVTSTVATSHSAGGGVPSLTAAL